jgi:hypothetical protein
MATEFRGERSWVGRGGPPVDGLGGRPAGELVRDLLGQGQRLFREEVRLAKAELKDEAKTAGKASGTAAAGGVVAYVGFLALTCAAIAALATGMPVWLGALFVGVVYAVVGGVMAKGGVSKLKRMEKRPRETTETLEEDRRWASETMRAVRSRTRANA